MAQPFNYVAGGGGCGRRNGVFAWITILLLLQIVNLSHGQRTQWQRFRRKFSYFIVTHTYI